jgi:signal transduction histidine kinase
MTEPFDPSRRVAAVLPLDVLVGVLAALAQVVGTTIFVGIAGAEEQIDLLGYALLLAGALPLFGRDRYPIPVLLVVAASAVAYMLLGYPGGFYTISLIFALWAAVAAGHRIASVAVAVALVAFIVVAGYLVPSGHFRDPDAAIWFAGWLVAAIVLGEVSRGRLEYLEQVERRAFEAERTREEEALRRAGEERLRIARELHDVLTHHISVISVQAGVAVHLLDKRADEPPSVEQTALAREALASISESSREAMRELRGILGVLRDTDQADPRAPTPGLDAIDDLVASAKGTGLDVEVETHGERPHVPVGTDLAAYRIIQESLTNVARHADARHAWVSVTYGQREIEVEVTDDGRGVTDGEPLEQGNGVSGMRERAVAVGGSLDADARPDGGFRVRARLPIEATS